jgi:hypothetical protein
MRLAVELPPGEDESEWLAVHSENSKLAAGRCDIVPLDTA